MKRNYDHGTADEITFFVGQEIEHTPAYGMTTLFVVGVHDVEDIEFYRKKHKCEHIFFGANHSFNPGINFPNDADQWDEWENMIQYFLKKDILCTLDSPYSHATAILETCLVENDLFIPQIRIVLPYVKQYNYNTMIKIDDKDFKWSNPGVWCHRLHDLMNPTKFTDWSKYSLDTIIK
jgi:hypothetical protein